MVHLPITQHMYGIFQFKTISSLQLTSRLIMVLLALALTAQFSSGFPPAPCACMFAMCSWPKTRTIYDRPAFLEQYPCLESQQYNVNSFLGKLDPHNGKYYVPPHKYPQFLQVRTHERPQSILLCDLMSHFWADHSRFLAGHKHFKCSKVGASM